MRTRFLNMIVLITITDKSLNKNCLAQLKFILTFITFQCNLWQVAFCMVMQQQALSISGHCHLQPVLLRMPCKDKE